MLSGWRRLIDPTRFFGERAVGQGINSASHQLAAAFLGRTVPHEEVVVSISSAGKPNVTLQATAIATPPINTNFPEARCLVSRQACYAYQVS